jgi:hypothetical protein
VTCENGFIAAGLRLLNEHGLPGGADFSGRMVVVVLACCISPISTRPAASRAPIRTQNWFLTCGFAIFPCADHARLARLVIPTPTQSYDSLDLVAVSILEPESPPEAACFLLSWAWQKCKSGVVGEWTDVAWLEPSKGQTVSTTDMVRVLDSFLSERGMSRSQLADDIRADLVYLGPAKGYARGG